MRLTGFRQKFSAVLGYPPKECISKKREKEETMMLVIKKKKKGENEYLRVLDPRTCSREPCLLFADSHTTEQ